MLFATLFDVIMILFQVIQGLLIAYMIISMLFSFNVINSSNQFLMSVYHAVDALLQPLLNPIRKILPHTGGMDFSPLGLIVLMQIITRVLVRYQEYYL